MRRETRMKRSARGMSIILLDSLNGITRSIVDASLCCAMLLLATPLRAELPIQPPDQSNQPAHAGKINEWGSTVAVDGDTAMIHGTVTDDNSNMVGVVEVYVRHRSGKWVYVSTIHSPDNIPFGPFAENFALRGDIALFSNGA